jgi:hypothetical protein
MRILLKAEWPVEVSNAAIKDGSMSKTVQSILDKQKPEAAYFLTSNGKRTTIIILDMQDSSQMTEVAEPWFPSFNASIEFTPVLNFDDWMRGGQGIEKAVKKYG